MIELDALNIDDLPIFLEIRNECADQLHDNSRFQLSQALMWWKKHWGDDFISSGSPRYYSINKIKDDESVMVGYARARQDFDNRIATIGVDIHKDHRRKRYACEAYKWLLNYFFIDSKCNRVQLEVLSTNKAALTLYKKIGFRQEGIRRQAVYRQDQNLFIDSIMMSITADEWERDNESSQPS